MGSWRCPKLGDAIPSRGLPASCYQWGGLSPGAGRDLSKASYDPTGMQFYMLTSFSSVSINSTLSPTRDWLSRGGLAPTAEVQKERRQTGHLSILCSNPSQRQQTALSYGAELLRTITKPSGLLLNLIIPTPKITSEVTRKGLPVVGDSF